MRFNNPLKRKIVLYETGDPAVLSKFLNHVPGVWKLILTPGVVVVTDDNGNTGYYSNQNTVVYTTISLSVNNVYYTEVDSVAALVINQKRWYYDSVTTTLYICFENWDEPFDKEIQFGVIYGFCKNLDILYINDMYYENRISSVFGVKKSKDPLFFGMLKFSQGTVKLINEDGKYDNWNDRKTFRKPSRILIGEYGDEYSAYKKIYSGLIGDYSQSWHDITIDNDDVRSGMTNPIPYNAYTVAEYVNLKTTNEGKLKPIAYGKIYNAPCMCLSEAVTDPVSFHFMDTEYHDAIAFTQAYVDGVAVASANVDLTAGTFTITKALVGGKYTGVTADFQGCSIGGALEGNGVEIIKDLLENYGDTPYDQYSYDTTEVDAASTAVSARKDSLYINKQTKLNKAIEDLCNDIDGLFFPKDSGLLTIRIFDDTRTPVKTIYKDDWFGEPTIKNNTSEFLSSCIVQYKKDQKKNEYSDYVNTDYEDAVYGIYNSKQSKTFQTGLTDAASAALKSETIMLSSKAPTDIVTRQVKFQHYDLEIMDFIYADPKCRNTATYSRSIWEIIGIDKNLDTWTITLTLKYISEIPT